MVILQLTIITLLATLVCLACAALNIPGMQRGSKMARAAFFFCLCLAVVAVTMPLWERLL